MADPTDHKLRKVVVSRQRYDETESPDYDITRAVAEINLYESIYVPYITGSIAVADTSALSSMINYQGQEEVLIQIEVGDRLLSRTFVIYSVSNTIKSKNDSTSTYVLQIIEKHAYLAAFRRLRGFYKGKPEFILANVLDRKILVLDSSDQSFKILGVNRTPMEVAMWVIERSTSAIGEPMFAYSSLKEDGISFTSLGEMLSRAPLIDYKFRYSQVPYTDISNRFIHDATTIHSVQIPEQNNMLDVARSGAIRSRFFAIDTLTRSVDHVDFKAEEYFEEKKEAGRTLNDHTLFDKNFKLDGENISNSESRYVSQITTSQLFSDENSYDEDELFAQKFKLSRHSDLVMLDRERFEILVPGVFFLGLDVNSTIGTVIDVSIPKDQPAFSETDISNIEDKKRSGLFLITNARHIFNVVDNEYRVSLSLGRTEAFDRLNESSREDTEKRPR